MTRLVNRALGALVLCALVLGGASGCATPPIARQLAADAHPALAYANAHARDGRGYRAGLVAHDGRTLHYVEAGEGDLILFYHGFPSFWFSFYPIMERLKSDYHVVAVDALGAGLSDKPEETSPYALSALAAHLDAVARDRAGAAPFVLVGHDWGAALALAFAEAYPERLSAVVGMSAPSYNVFLDLVATNAEQAERSAYLARLSALAPPVVRADPPGERIWRQSYASLHAGGHISDEEMALYGAAVSPPEATIGGVNWYRANAPAAGDAATMARWPSPPRTIETPALLIWGELEPVFVPQAVEAMERAAPGLVVARQAGVGHWTPMQDPDASAQAIARFLVDVKTLN